MSEWISLTEVEKRTRTRSRNASPPKACAKNWAGSSCWPPASLSWKRSHQKVPNRRHKFEGNTHRLLAVFVVESSGILVSAITSRTSRTNTDCMRIYVTH